MRCYEDMSRSELVSILEHKDEEIGGLQSKLEDRQFELEKLQEATWPEPTPFFVRIGDINRQLLHIMEEVGEASKELRRWNIERQNGNSSYELMHIESDLAQEVADIIFSCFTELELLGYDDERRSDLFESIINKNKKRGYYD